jgi:feruloyl esterase
MAMRTTLLLTVVVLGVVPAARAQQSCDSITGVKLANATVTSATLVAEGPFAGPAGRGATARPPTVPAHCDVRGVIRPTRDSEIKFALWLPTAAAWNGKYRQEGNGGWAGAINDASLIDPLRRGYAVAATDDGHEGGFGAAWAIGHPEKLIDFGSRAVHETSVQSKAIVRVFYGRDAERSYFDGCSDGGREALMEAQRYPDDFVGILAGAPASNWSHLFTGFVWNEHALLMTPGSAIPPAKLPAIQRAVLATCDGVDGVKDGLIEDPRACRFDPSVLLCKGADTAECLTAPQVTALQKIYAGPKNPRTGEQIFPGQPKGTEGAPGSWSAWITPAAPAGAIQFGFGNSYYGAAVFEDPKWDFHAFDLDRDVRIGDAKAGPILNATSPDLRSFRAGGGKLIQYHGWGDAAISAISSIDYYDSVRTFLSRYPDARAGGTPPIDDFYRLFMVPGMGHCGGGAGPNRFGNGGSATSSDPDHDVFTALERWVERGTAPERIIGTGVTTDEPTRTLTRPLCPYPMRAKYRGAGDVTDAANFICGS